MTGAVADKGRVGEGRKGRTGGRIPNPYFRRPSRNAAAFSAAASARSAFGTLRSHLFAAGVSTSFANSKSNIFSRFSSSRYRGASSNSRLAAALNSGFSRS